MAIDFSRQPPALGADIPRVKADGRPTDPALDLEQFQRNWYAQTVVDLDTRLTEVRDDFDDSSASFQEQIDALADADQAIIQSQTEFQAQVGSVIASVEQQVGAAVDATSALAADVSTLSTTLDGQTAELEVLAASVDGIGVQYSITGTIDNTTGGLIISGARTIDGGAAFGIAFAASSFSLTDPNLPSGGQQVFSYSTELGAFTFNIPLIITGEFIAPGAIATSKLIEIPALTFLAAGAAAETDVQLFGFDVPVQYNTTKLLDIEAKCSVRALNASVTNLRIAILDVQTGAIIDVQTIIDEVPTDDTPTRVMRQRYFVRIEANRPYVIRYMFNYVSGIPASNFRSNGMSIRYLAVTESQI